VKFRDKTLDRAVETAAAFWLIKKKTCTHWLVVSYEQLEQKRRITCRSTYKTAVMAAASFFPEEHPQFVGVYWEKLAPGAHWNCRLVRQYYMSSATLMIILPLVGL
jgi:TPP-dependent 2-oxoacid decarboxylase